LSCFHPGDIHAAWIRTQYQPIVTAKENQLMERSWLRLRRWGNKLAFISYISLHLASTAEIMHVHPCHTNVAKSKMHCSFNIKVLQGTQIATASKPKVNINMHESVHQMHWTLAMSLNVQTLNNNRNNISAILWFATYYSTTHLHNIWTCSYPLQLFAITTSFSTLCGKTGGADAAFLIFIMNQITGSFIIIGLVKQFCVSQNNFYSMIMRKSKTKIPYS